MAKSQTGACHAAGSEGRSGFAPKRQRDTNRSAHGGEQQTFANT